MWTHFTAGVSLGFDRVHLLIGPLMSSGQPHLRKFNWTIGIMSLDVQRGSTNV